MTDRSYNRRRAMADFTITASLMLLMLGLFGCVVFVLAHFIVKFW